MRIGARKVASHGLVGGSACAVAQWIGLAVDTGGRIGGLLGDIGNAPFTRQNGRLVFFLYTHRF